MAHEHNVRKSFPIHLRLGGFDCEDKISTESVEAQIELDWPTVWLALGRRAAVISGVKR